ncbi:signal peptide peptidase SppA [uncultured Fusobacterium sp.]|uniref:signal peptide peptidase SppA n=1 Tax=uncultured Fusobacterium sp. TaxID=159267 RepID=UPI002601E628|nr:signal peptide peptidase SppA [uncultured Fusobacterium sp.]
MKLFKFLKNLIFGTVIFIIKEIFSFFIKLVLMSILLLVIIGIFNKYSSQKEKNNLKIEKGSYIVIDLGNKYSEKSETIPNFLKDGEINFFSLLKKLDSINSNPNVEGIFLKLDNITLDRAQIEELGSKLNILKENNKKILSFALNLNNRNYSLALNSNEIIMPPTMSANVNLTGYYSELAYYKGLADKFGVKFNVIHVGDYKSYGENFTKKEMSNEYRENIKRLHDKIYDNFLNKIIIERKINKELINDRILNGDFVFSEPHQMEKFHLIDKLAYEEDIFNTIKKKKLIPIEKYQETKINSPEKIAIIYGEGSILLSSEKGSIGNSITPDKISNEIDKALENPEIKGIVLRLNSPGGSALASNIIHHKLKEASKQKPIYISIGGVAASGGYYIAVSGNKIFADKESITGSIGVVSLIPNFNGLMKKLDINIETVKKGKYSDLFSLTKDFTEEDEEKIYASSFKVYSEFLDIVAQGRELDRDYVHSIAQGKVWLGEEAKNLKLIDEIGGLELTINTLAKDLKLSNYEVIEIVESDSFETILKQYLPFKTLIQNFSSLDENNELFFKPSYFFPYNL